MQGLCLSHSPRRSPSLRSTRALHDDTALCDLVLTMVKALLKKPVTIFLILTLVLGGATARAWLMMHVNEMRAAWVFVDIDIFGIRAMERTAWRPEQVQKEQEWKSKQSDAYVARARLWMVAATALLIATAVS